MAARVQARSPRDWERATPRARRRGRAPIRPQQVERARGEWHIPIAAAFPGAHMDDHACPINIARQERYPLRQPQTARGDQRQRHPRLRIAHGPQPLMHLRDGEHIGQGVPLRGSHEIEHGPRARG